MMLRKIRIFIFLTSLCIFPLYSETQPVEAVCAEKETEASQILFKKTSRASTQEVARATFEAAGYVLGNARVERRGSIWNGGGLFESLVTLDGVETRIITYGPGEYAIPHYHNEDEWFLVTYGECDAWQLGEIVLSEDKATFAVVLYEKSIYRRCKVGDVMTVPAYMIHCLVADDCHGFCRQVPRAVSPDSLSRHMKKLAIPSGI